jgi:hypothetical protein
LVPTIASVFEIQKAAAPMPLNPRPDAEHAAQNG